MPYPRSSGRADTDTHERRQIALSVAVIAGVFAAQVFADTSVGYKAAFGFLETGVGAAYGVLLALLSALAFVAFGTGGAAAPERN